MNRKVGVLLKMTASSPFSTCCTLCPHLILLPSLTFMHPILPLLRAAAEAQSERAAESDGPCGCE